MFSIKAILVGFGAVIFLGLTLELVFLFIDIGYNILMAAILLSICSARAVFYYVHRWLSNINLRRKKHPDPCDFCEPAKLCNCPVFNQ